MHVAPVCGAAPMHLHFLVLHGRQATAAGIVVLSSLVGEGDLYMHLDEPERQ